jgi:hypothetical protein
MEGELARMFDDMQQVQLRTERSGECRRIMNRMIGRLAEIGRYTNPIDL